MLSKVVIFRKPHSHVYILTYAFDGSEEFYLSCCDFVHCPMPCGRYVPFELEHIVSCEFSTFV